MASANLPELIYVCDFGRSAFFKYWTEGNKIRWAGVDARRYTIRGALGCDHISFAVARNRDDWLAWTSCFAPNALHIGRQDVIRSQVHAMSFGREGDIGSGVDQETRAASRLADELRGSFS